MSEKEDVKLDELAAEVKMINLTLKGDVSHGIEGLIPMLQRHMRESSENFNTFKTTVVGDNIINYKRTSENQKNLDKRITDLEDSEKKQTKLMGYATGVGVFLGFLGSYLYELIKKVLPI